MFAVGHLSLGYLSAKVSSKLLGTKINLPLVFLFSLIPDIDILVDFVIPGAQIHRTITHSILIATIVSAPFFILYKKKAIPYFIALIQHSLIGDFITGGSYAGGPQLLWPLTSATYGLPICINSLTNMAIEWSSFIVATIVMLITKDLQNLLKGKLSTLSLSIPTTTVLLPTFLHFPLIVPSELIIPHLVYLAIFALSLIIPLASVVKSRIRN